MLCTIASTTAYDYKCKKCNDGCNQSCKDAGNFFNIQRYCSFGNYEFGSSSGSNTNFDGQATDGDFSVGGEKCTSQYDASDCCNKFSMPSKPPTFSPPSQTTGPTFAPSRAMVKSIQCPAGSKILSGNLCNKAKNYGKQCACQSGYEYNGDDEYCLNKAADGACMCFMAIYADENFGLGSTRPKCVQAAGPTKNPTKIPTKNPTATVSNKHCSDSNGFVNERSCGNYQPHERCVCGSGQKLIGGKCLYGNDYRCFCFDANAGGSCEWPSEAPTSWPTTFWSPYQPTAPVTSAATSEPTPWVTYESTNEDDASVEEQPSGGGGMGGAIAGAAGVVIVLAGVGGFMYYRKRSTEAGKTGSSTGEARPQSTEMTAYSPKMASPKHVNVNKV